jgi:hypothetical protein
VKPYARITVKKNGLPALGVCNFGLWPATPGNPNFNLNVEVDKTVVGENTLGLFVGNYSFVKAVKRSDQMHR